MILFRFLVPLLLLVSSGLARDVQLAQSADIGDGIAAFFPRDMTPGRILPSLLLLNLPSVVPLPTSWTIKFIFSQEAKHLIAKVPVRAGTSFYGTGEVKRPFVLTRRQLSRRTALRRHLDGR
jgi:alpha-glucosidase